MASYTNEKSWNFKISSLRQGDNEFLGACKMSLRNGRRLRGSVSFSASVFLRGQADVKTHRVAFNLGCRLPTGKVGLRNF